MCPNCGRNNCSGSKCKQSELYREWKEAVEIIKNEVYLPNNRESNYTTTVSQSKVNSENSGK